LEPEGNVRGQMVPRASTPEPGEDSSEANDVNGDAAATTSSAPAAAAPSGTRPRRGRGSTTRGGRGAATTARSTAASAPTSSSQPIEVAEDEESETDGLDAALAHAQPADD
jgi:hypothetical protein